jgi:hypothetical protein
MDVCREFCVLSGRGLCVRPVILPEESYRVWRVWVWSWVLDPEGDLPHWGLLRLEKRKATSQNKEQPLRWNCVCRALCIYLHNTGCPGRNVKNFGRVSLMLKFTDITQNTYIQSWTVTEIMDREVW